MEREIHKAWTAISREVDIDERGADRYMFRMGNQQVPSAWWDEK